jgi:hypothetical protein
MSERADVEGAQQLLEEQAEERAFAKIQVKVDRLLYLKLWEYIKRRYPVPYKKLHIVVNEALREYLERRGIKVG